MSPQQNKRSLGAPARSTRPSTTKRHSNHGVPKSKNVQVKTDEPEEETMAASFIPFCTYCERQILTPSNSILYCSESCRRRDHTKSLSYSNASANQSPPLTPLTAFSFEDLPVRDIVPQRSPTAVTTNRYSYSELSEKSEDSVQLSEDEQHRPRLPSQDSDAARYLRSFHSAEAQAEMATRTRRPRYDRSSTSISRLSTGAPSLSHSPSSTDPISMPYTPSTRPLPPRHNPFSSSYGARGIDLVNPFVVVQPIIPTTAPSSLAHGYSFKAAPVSGPSTDLAEGNVMYEKKASIAMQSPSNGSLKQLFRFSEMQAPPASNGA